MIPAEIDYISNVDFTKGFSSWHIQWPVANILKKQYSTNFDTVVRSENGTNVLLKWYLGMGLDSAVDGHKWFGLHQEESSATAVAFLRLAVSSKGKEPLFNSTLPLFVTPNSGRNHGWSLPTDVVGSHVCDDTMFHCWIDIPNGTPTVNNRKRNLNGDLINTGFRRRACESLSPGFEALFKGVLDQDPDLRAFSDVTLTAVLGKNKQRRSFYCHRNILSAHSSVFRRMFANEKWKEAASKTEGVVEIDDIGAETLECVLKYIYTGATLSADGYSLPFRECSKFWAVVHAAEKYDLPELIEFCSAVFISDFGGEHDRINQLLHADRYRLHQLKAVCIAALSTNLAVFEDAESSGAFPKELRSELLQASRKRQLETKNITVETEDE